ncbi:MAG TPA: DUF6771 family protein [Sphingomonadaceae bacterium]|nr:DUF6771 family protein [Sphingomonadaceae bacterium]
MRQDQLLHEVAAVLQRVPQWARIDMASPDALLRARAEDTLAAMIVAALTESSEWIADRRAYPPPPFDHPSLPLEG